MVERKGCIALDIDGTLTHSRDHLPAATQAFLSKLHREGWELLFATGRTYKAGIRPVQSLEVPFGFSAQNGSLLLSMPEQLVIARQELSTEVIPRLDAICTAHRLTLVVFAGWELHDFALYRTAPAHDPVSVHERAARGGEVWKQISHWSELPMRTFPMARAAGPPAACAAAAQEMAQEKLWHTVSIQDPFEPAHHLLLCTHPLATKGNSLRTFLDWKGMQGCPVVAAGNDQNDCSLLAMADRGIAITGSPPSLLQHAHYLAPPVDSEGVIEGLTWALQHLPGD